MEGGVGVGEAVYTIGNGSHASKAPSQLAIICRNYLDPADGYGVGLAQSIMGNGVIVGIAVGVGVVEQTTGKSSACARIAVSCDVNCVAQNKNRVVPLTVPNRRRMCLKVC